jgi:hypothetical protein
MNFDNILSLIFNKNIFLIIIIIAILLANFWFLLGFGIVREMFDELKIKPENLSAAALIVLFMLFVLMYILIQIQL